MRSVIALFLLTFSSVCVLGQKEPSASADLTIVKYTWAKERLNWDDTQAITPGGVQNRPRSRAPRTAAYRKKEASEQQSARLAASDNRQPPEDTRFQYTYNLVVRNDSQKKIREIDWDYIFFDASSLEELGRRQFTSAEKIEAGKIKKLSIRVHTPPTQKINANQAGKKEAAGLSEKIEIVRIVYADDTEWNAPSQN